MEILTEGVLAALKGKIQKGGYDVEIGGKPTEQLLTELEAQDVDVVYHARNMMRSPMFSTLPVPEVIRVARLTSADLGFTRPPRIELNGPSLIELFYRHILALGLLDLCPAETGPQARLQDTQIRNNYYSVAMKEIPIEDIWDEHVFTMGHSQINGQWLNVHGALPHEWEREKWLLRVHK